jgi:hypothetical protein
VRSPKSIQLCTCGARKSCALDPRSASTRPGALSHIPHFGYYNRARVMRGNALRLTCISQSNSARGASRFFGRIIRTSPVSDHYCQNPDSQHPRLVVLERWEFFLAFALLLMRRKRGNPNWSAGLPPQPLRAAATEFEKEMRKLGLTQKTCASSSELRRWCERNKDRCYVPEWLLKEWGIDADVDVLVTVQRSRARVRLS